MPFALIPDGYSLKKVTKLQEKAVNDKRRHDNVMLLIENPQIITIATGIITGILVKQALESVEIPTVDKDAILTTYQKSIILPFTAPASLVEKFGIADIPTTKAETEKLIRDLGLGRFL